MILGSARGAVVGHDPAAGHSHLSARAHNGMRK